MKPRPAAQRGFDAPAWAQMPASKNGHPGRDEHGRPTLAPRQPATRLTAAAAGASRSLRGCGPCALDEHVGTEALAPDETAEADGESNAARVSPALKPSRPKLVSTVASTPKTASLCRRKEWSWRSRRGLHISSKDHGQKPLGEEAVTLTMAPATMRRCGSPYARGARQRQHLRLVWLWRASETGRR